MYSHHSTCCIITTGCMQIWVICVLSPNFVCRQFAVETKHKNPICQWARAWSHIIYRTKLNMADTWSEKVEACLITSWQTFPLLYDVADKHYDYLKHVLKLHSDIISPFYRILEKSMYTMTDICLLVYFLPHLSLCGFIRYLIKYKFATNNDSGVSQTLIYFSHRNSPINESKRASLKGGPQLADRAETRTTLYGS